MLLYAVFCLQCGAVRCGAFVVCFILCSAVLFLFLISFYGFFLLQLTYGNMAHYVHTYIHTDIHMYIHTYKHVNNVYIFANALLLIFCFCFVFFSSLYLKVAFLLTALNHYEAFVIVNVCMCVYVCGFLIFLKFLECVCVCVFV